MNWGKTFAWVIAILSFCAAIGFAYQKNWRMAAYWLFAGGIGVTFAW